MSTGTFCRYVVRIIKRFLDAVQRRGLWIPVRAINLYLSRLYLWKLHDSFLSVVFA